VPGIRIPTRAKKFTMAEMICIMILETHKKSSIPQI
jgi:hypothetical protein